VEIAVGEVGGKQRGDKSGGEQTRVGGGGRVGGDGEVWERDRHGERERERSVGVETGGYL